MADIGGKGSLVETVIERVLTKTMVAAHFSVISPRNINSVINDR